jgi:DNA-binding MarR family transcriptional regulator
VASKGSTIPLNKLLRAVEEFRKIDPEMPPQTIETYLWVAMQPGLTMKEIADRVGLSQSAISRNIQALSKWHRLNKPGYDLVTATEDPRERRRKIVTLTPKGERVATSLREIIGD